jgi:epoxyqueuosine reductase
LAEPLPLAEALKRRAREAGADLAGIAPARPLAEAAAYSKWIADGRQAEMQYMARNADSREDITKWYAEAKSVLVCGFSYSGPDANPPREGRGRLARYAALPDYHPEIKRRLGEVLDWLKTAAPGADGRIFVDTSPVLERLYARYGGLGWVGKNTMLISPKKGSFFFLAGIALNLDLPHDAAETDHCGSCTRCIDACPTDAFPEPRVLDANKCIAYFTIEHRGEIPDAMRPGVGDWILGCDVCQDVCPWNRFSRAGSAFGAPEETSLPLADLSRLTAQEFKSRFGATPVSRPKRRGFLRNVALAMGNERAPRHRPDLERLAADADPVVAEQARWSLAQLPPDGHS